MPIRIPLKAIRVRRDGKNITPPIGKKFDFTDAELKDLASIGDVDDFVRKPINEGGEEVVPAGNKRGGNKRGAGKAPAEEVGAADETSGEGDDETL